MTFFNKSELPKKLNIGIVANKFPILDRATDHGFLWPIARGLAQRGHKVTVFSWKNATGESEVSQDGVKAYFLGEGDKRPALPFDELVDRKIKSLHSQNAFHIILSVDAGGLKIGSQKKELGLAMVYDIEATQMSQVISILGMAQETMGSLLRTSSAVAYKFLTTYFGRDRKILSTADAVFVTSIQQRLILERYYMYPEFKTHVVPFGVEITDLSPREKSLELQKKLGLPENAHTVVTITDMTELGEIRNLLRAFEKVAIKKPAARMLIVGNGPLRKEIEFEMLNLALGSRVFFTGAVSSESLPDYIALADVYINLSARTSGFEASTLEAMAQKKVIIGSEVSPINTLVENGKDGFLIRPADTAHLADILLNIFTGQIESHVIGENARAKILHFFDTNKMITWTLEAYYKAMLNTGSYRKASFSERLTTQTLSSTNS